MLHFFPVLVKNYFALPRVCCIQFQYPFLLRCSLSLKQVGPLWQLVDLSHKRTMPVLISEKILRNLYTFLPNYVALLLEQILALKLLLSFRPQTIHIGCYQGVYTYHLAIQFPWTFLKSFPILFFSFPVFFAFVSSSFHFVLTYFYVSFLFYDVFFWLCHNDYLCLQYSYVLGHKVFQIFGFFFIFSFLSCLSLQIVCSFLPLPSCTICLLSLLQLKIIYF